LFECSWKNKKNTQNGSCVFFSKSIEFHLNADFLCKTNVLEFLEKSKTHNHLLKIGEDKQSVKSPPKPFHTSRLLQVASNVLHMSPKTTMEICQKLYQRNKIAKGAWNFGPNSKNFLKVKELIKKITSISNFKIKYKTKKSYLFESKILKLNNSKSKKNLGWTPILSIDQMINFTFSWYELMIQNKKKLYDLTIMQIEFFIKKIKKKKFIKK
jgi:DNA topoisomerase IA